MILKGRWFESVFLFYMVPWLRGIVSQPESTAQPPCRLCPCMQSDTQGIYQLQVHCTQLHVKSGGNLWLAADRVRERFRGSVKINQRNEEISDLLAPQSFPSLRLIFMSIHHEWSSQTLQLQVYGAWIVTLFQLSPTFECAECWNIKRKGHGTSLVSVQCGKKEKEKEASLGSPTSHYFYSS